MYDINNYVYLMFSPPSLVGCAPGYYQGVVDGEKVCSVCAVGYYQTSDSTTSCDQCPSGRTTVRNGSRTMEDCLGKL